MTGSNSSRSPVAAIESLGSHVAAETVRFTRRLRAAGVAVPANAALSAAEALVVTGVTDREAVRTALFATLIRDPGDRDRFDRLFETFWSRLRAGFEGTDAPPVDDDGTAAASESQSALPGPMDGNTPDTGGDVSDDRERLWKDTSRRVSEATDAETVEESDETHAGTASVVRARYPVGTEGEGADRLDRTDVERIQRAIASLPGRRRAPAANEGEIALRRTLRKSLRTGGVALSLPRREHPPKTISTTFLIDVSSSVLDALDREFLQAFLDEWFSRSNAARVFFFDTHIREVTDAFRSDRGEPGRTLDTLEGDWGGGTLIGESLATLRRRWPNAIDRQTVTVVISDGLEVGDVADLEASMAWLARRSSGVLWLNPLATSVEYEPTARGMAASLPFVDGLFAFGDTDDVAEIARQLERRGLSGPIGYQYDFRDRPRGTPESP